MSRETSGYSFFSRDIIRVCMGLSRVHKAYLLRGVGLRVFNC